ncbi:MAG: ATP-binding protein [Sphaerochaeta sp.]|jgi:hypothetical protein|nr:ATP-binding protein [Sphaerochaeta sp.]
MIQFTKAQRSKAKLRLGLCGPSGSGKTKGSLEIAKGLGGRVVLLDTENHSGELYANDYDYDYSGISSPYTVEKYLEAIKAAEQAGYDVIIIDSLTHAWAGDGGLLERQGELSEIKGNNSYTAWRHVTPLHNRLIDAMLQSPCHVIVTMRSKVDYVLVEETNSSGHKVQKPQKVGMAPIQREGMDYEMTTVFDIDVEHKAVASKDRTSIFADGLPFVINGETGQMLKQWLDTGKDEVMCERCGRNRATVRSSHGKDYCHVCNGQYEEYLKKQPTKADETK